MTVTTVTARSTARRLAGRAALAATAALLSLAAMPDRAAAQFTGVVTPPPRPVETVTAAPSAADSTRADSLVAATKLTDMKTWVDSAAGTLGVSTGRAPTDSASMAAGTASRGGSGNRDMPADADPTMRDGAPAPDTATPLPMLALIGVTALGGGLLLRRTPSRRPAVARRIARRG